MNYKTYFAVSITIICSALTACNGGSVTQAMGINKTTPDEFNVVTLPPLSVPPEFRLVEPAKATGSVNTSRSIQTQAKNALLSRYGSTTGQNASETASAGEQWLLKKTGADSVNPNIRDLITQDNAVKKKKDSSFFGLKKLISSDNDVDATIDANSEEQRLLEELKQKI